MYNARVEDNSTLHTLFNLALGAALGVFGAFVIATLWAWYLVPIGLPSISLLTAFGIDLIVTLLTFSVPTGKTDLTNAQLTERLLRWALAFPATVLIWGWAAHALFG